MTDAAKTKAELISELHELRKQNSDLENLLDEKDWLFRKIHHQVKNNLQIISSLLMLQSQQMDNEKCAICYKSCMTRINFVSLLHTHLYDRRIINHEMFKAFVNDLTLRLSQSYANGKPINFKIIVSNIGILISQAVSVCLILNEFLIFILEKLLEFDIKAEIGIFIEELPGNLIQLRITDNCLEIPIDLSNPSSLSLEVVTSMVEYQLKGSMELKKERERNPIIKFKKLEQE